MERRSDLALCVIKRNVITAKRGFLIEILGFVEKANIFNYQNDIIK